MGANDAIIFDAARVREFECMAPQAMMGTVSARDSTTALPICMPFLISGAFRLSAAVWGGRTRHVAHHICRMPMFRHRSLAITLPALYPGPPIEESSNAPK
jgi:hypothetical protein